MTYAENEINQFIDYDNYWDIKEYLKGRRHSFARWASCKEWMNGDGLYDMLKEFEKSNPRFPGRDLRQIILRKYKSCTVCKSEDDLCVDHIIPYSKGGLTVEENLTVLCRTCNLRKRDKYNG